jgi:hypothetical protein
MGHMGLYILEWNRKLRGRDPRSNPHFSKEREREAALSMSSTAGGAEGAGAPALSPRPQGHPQLGCSPPPLLPGRELPPLSPHHPPDLADLISCSSPAQASDLRDKFEANRNVVTPSSSAAAQRLHASVWCGGCLKSRVSF